MGDYRKLKVWKRAHALALGVYKDTMRSPATERHGLADQLRRSVTSIVSNIVEGASRQSDGDMGRFLQIARGSLCEADYQVVLARDLGYVSAERHAEIAKEADEIGRMLAGLMTHLRKAKAARRATART